MDGHLDDPETARTLALAVDLRVVLGTLIRKLREQSNPEDLTAAQKAVLIRLERDDALTVTTLARAEGVRPQSMGATIATLQAAGLISGSPDPTDGRQTLLSLTAACRTLIKTKRAAKEDWLFRILRTKLASAEQEKLATAVELLKRLVDS